MERTIHPTVQILLVSRSVMVRCTATSILLLECKCLRAGPEGAAGGPEDGPGEAGREADDQAGQGEQVLQITSKVVR